MKSADIREAFLAYFESRQHTRVPSSSLVPRDDPTLLFANAGMNQFKQTFLGREPRDYVRACSSQRCVRAGGKHNDLENVGYTARHHTFFEMLGNFSFGDYFKREAIGFAWEFLTGTLGLPAERLWVTVHVSDDEAADLWLRETGVSAERFSRLDEPNFWQMGSTGPCGPCSEIFYDHGEDVPGGPPGSDGDELDRYVEIWNLVFMQYNRDAEGGMEPLPAPSVDTGMGLERIAAVVQGVHSNYEIDLFRNLLRAAADVLGLESVEHNSLRVIADHIRSCAFLIADGVIPGNEGRGYVLRRIIRRAIRHGSKLGAKQAFFHGLVAPLAGEMGAAYPELRENRAGIEQTLLSEEEQFARTLDNGLGILEMELAGLEGGEIPGELVFRLYDSYGFPVDLTNDIARERGLTLDMPGYEAAMAEQRRRSQRVSVETIPSTAEFFAVTAVRVGEGGTEFIGYHTLTGDGVVAVLLRGGDIASSLARGEEGAVVLDRTPFYAEAGGQVGDTGYLVAEGVRFEVRDTARHGDRHLHYGVVLEGGIAPGMSLSARVDGSVRRATALNHSATHLLHAALRRVLGERVEQKGSLVDSRRLRFDFSHPRALTDAERKAVERLVNEQIRANTEVSVRSMDMESALKAGAVALFGEKYGDEVRVLTMGEDNFSVELCGGTHVSRTGDIGLLRITSESGVSAGVRRLEAVTGAGALEAFDDAERRIDDIRELVKGDAGSVVEKVRALRAANRDLEKEVERLKRKLASAAGLADRAVAVNGARVLAASLDGADPKSLRDAVDRLKQELGSGVILLAAVEGEKIALTAGVTEDLTGRVKAGDLMKEFAGRLGGRGGGRADMAQGGGSDVGALPAALRAVPEWVRERLR